ncbi:protein FAR1-RELATED SEQUENCE 5-like [Citrus clementina]|uniref:protein FAR1-RELATED SEQUENCE 5-like n=1 Tax=Citrus clementina TaxID=85681 RepID=UPI000CED24F6|nr:protein FAR1-RELATED SEQUENCE 5-like [Citrus x clementina]
MEKDIEVEELEKFEENDEPIIGMSFDSDVDLFIYFKEYGKRKGFPILRRTSRKDSDGILRNVTFACGRSGETRSKSVNILKPQPNAKTGCNARLGAGLGDDGKWTIRSLNLEHNHVLLTPTKSKYFRCNRSLNTYAKKRLDVNDRAGIRLCKNYQSLVIEAGGHENVTFIERDCRNHVQKERRLRLGDGDAAALQNYFMKMQVEDNRFYFSMQVDDEGRLKNVFWAEPRNREAYKEFGDVVTFDTTYLTNKYDMPFAPFVGVNHHGHSILFGCGLISHEDIETFTWLFRTWLSCMSNLAPNGIITDQDRAMKVAIQNVFPNTRHRWCLWHIMKKVPEKLGGYKEYRNISNVLHCAVYDSQSATTFEETWHHMITEYDLGDNEWLRGLYDERHHWVPCYLNNTFWAGMSSTQRSESMNAFFDGYVNSKTTLKQFVEQYSCALKNKVQKEVEEDVRCLSQQMPCVTDYAIERQVRDVYTISKFQEFQQEMIRKMYCEYVNSMGCENIVREDVKVGEGKKRTFFEVYFEKENDEIRCSCSRFQFRGILCRHAIAIMIRNDVEVLPEKYILRRWRKDVWRCHSRVKTSYELHSCTDEQKRYEKMCATFAEVANMAAHTIESSNLVFNWIENVRGDLSKAILCGDNEVTVVTGQGSCSVEVETVRDPAARRRKGRPPCQRKKSNKFSKSKINSSRSNAKDGQVNEQVPTVVPTHENNVVTAFQNPEGSYIDMNMYPHGVMDYYNGLMSLPHMVGDNVYLTPTQNSCTEPQFQQPGHFQQLLFQQDNEYEVDKEF